MTEQRTASFTGWQPTGPNDVFGPSGKRQRLSPNPASPGVSPMNTSFPSFGTMNANRQQSSFNTPQSVNGIQDIARAPAGAMGPPSRPLDKEDTKATDVKSLFDMASGIGIDEKEEENYLLSSYRNAAETSFTSQSSQTISGNSSFDLLNQNRANGISGLPAAGRFSQNSSFQSPEEELDEKHKRAARAYNERREHHLDDPFLWGQSVRGRVQRIATDVGVKIPVEGLFDKIPERQQVQNVQGAASSGSQSAVLELRAPSILNRGAPLEAILSLVSLAANERIRSLVEDAFGLARGRQIGSDGVVPAEWASIVASPVVAEEKSASTTPSAPPNPLPQALTSISKADRLAEEAREKKRRARIARKAQSASATPGLEGNTGDLASPGTMPNGVTGLADRIPAETKMTKKERDRLAKADQTEEVLRRNANQTAIGQLAGGKTYSWMKSGGKGGGSGTSTPNRRVPATNGIGTTPVSASASKLAGGPKERVFGQWREDGEGGKQIQMRDWVSVLEADGRDKKTLAFAMQRLGGSDKDAK